MVADRSAIRSLDRGALRDTQSKYHNRELLDENLVYQDVSPEFGDEP